MSKARDGIRETAEEAVKDFEFAKAEASRISVKSALDQFEAAAVVLRKKSTTWLCVAALLFLALGAYLFFLPYNPPPIIREVVEAMTPGNGKSTNPMPVSVPLLIAASAYFTSVRLALIGLLGVGLAFSLRMTRAYLHMAEHNQHKIRVTNSIEAFVAAVRTNERKDLVLGKLVESVTDFGDSGILSNEEKPSGLPSVIFEAMTKNVGKND